ncbi:mannose-6-phosphate isomerase type 1 [Gillisia sp. Hel_I_86]|uniref:type I phosphomannose isomerase catalytic subunit n=1 Tax=Gillisia sp. Hel_I_86 TaxID=1249981 RepID=UPI00119C00DF|nr:type I phosphomannose isomerase catalytic subunit [Gillisia sp. Hel_I_86]TVZ27159.1 mannose-6-phosphate isomerase type 1 [Gillisia sp. Hel_I_86]
MKLYPLKFIPIFCYRIWGGNKLKNILNKEYHEDSIGESWEISDVDDFNTVVKAGPLKGQTIKDVITTFKSDVLGIHVYEKFGDEFPLLIKFIDAKTPLSIQVHPSDALAKERHNSFGKNEMWYIMEADDDAKLIVGFNKKVSKETYLEKLKKGNLIEVLNTKTVKKGDTYYIPTGRVHAIGAGVLLAEIQQTSNITYRIYDYDRVDAKTGEKRELHNELAIDAIDFKYYQEYKTDYNTIANTSNTLVHSPYFKTNILKLTKNVKKDYSKLDSFVIYMCVSGFMVLEVDNAEYKLKYGETLLLPSCLNHIHIKTEMATVLEVFM